MTGIKWRFGLLALWAVLCLLSGGCDRAGTTGLESAAPATAFPSPSPGGFYLGVLPIPAEDQSIEDAYQQAAQYARFVPVWGEPTPFYEMAETVGGRWGRLFIGSYIRGEGMFEVLHFSFMGPGLSLVAPSDMDDATLSDPAWRQAYRQAVLDTVRIVRPRYLSLGNEVNRWYEKYGSDPDDPNGFGSYISLYEEIYDEVKEEFSDTVIFCTFAREMVSDCRQADLSVLSLFDPDKMDMLVMTSYPHSVTQINRPSDIPDDYYSAAAAFMPGKPFGLIETAWPSMEAFGGERGQADFLTDAAGRLTMAQGMDLRLLGWAWLHDIDGADDTGLIERDGKEKAAYAVWKSFSGGG